MMNTAHPNWLREACPSWCTADHAAQILWDDQQHQSDALGVPVILRCRRHGTDPDRLAEPVSGEVEVAVFRDIEDAETWVAIAEGTRSIEITRESAARLSAVLAVLLRRAN